MHHPTDRIAHITAFVTPVVEHWLEREIAQWVHHEGSIWRAIAPWVNSLTTELHLTLYCDKDVIWGVTIFISSKRGIVSTHTPPILGSEMLLCGKSVCSWCDRSLDWSLMADPLIYFSFQPLLHDCCNKGHGMCYPICGMVHKKEPLLLFGKVTWGWLSFFKWSSV